MSEPEPFLMLDKNAREVLRIAPGDYKGATFVDVLLWAKTPEGLKPTHQSFTIRPEALGEVIRALERANASMATYARLERA